MARPELDEGLENRAVFTLSEVADATRGRPSGPLALQGTGVFTDTRAPIVGGIFVALRGPRFDANDRVTEAIQRGAVFAVCAEGRLPPGIAGVEVTDTLSALGGLARRVRDRAQAKVIAITGSVGKTSAKDMLARDRKSVV